jgi:hypothetical protein
MEGSLHVMEITSNHKGGIKILKRCELPFPWLKFKYISFLLECPIIVHFRKVKNNVQPSHMRIPSSDETKKTFATFNFYGKIMKIV